MPALTGHNSTALPTEVATYKNLPEGSSAWELPPATKGVAPPVGLELTIAPVDGVIVNSVSCAPEAVPLSIKMCRPVKSGITAPGRVCCDGVLTIVPTVPLVGSSGA